MDAGPPATSPSYSRAPCAVSSLARCAQTTSPALQVRRSRPLPQLVGAASGAEDVTVFAPTYASPVVIDVDQGKLSVIDLGRQADTDVT